MSKKSRLAVGAGFLWVALLDGCGSKGDHGAVDSAAAGSSGAVAGASSAPAKGTAKLEYEKTSVLYKAIFDLKNQDSQDKKIGDMKAKLGAPDKTEGDKAIWYAVDKNGGCFEFSASPNGAGFQMTEKSACGL